MTINNMQQRSSASATEMLGCCLQPFCYPIPPSNPSRRGRLTHSFVSISKLAGSHNGSPFSFAKSHPGPPQPRPAVDPPQPSCTLCIDVSRGGGLPDADGACNTLTTDLVHASTNRQYNSDARFVCVLPTTSTTVTACSVFQNVSAADDFLNSWSSDMTSQSELFSDFNINGYGMCQNPPYLYQDGATGSYQCGSQSSMETVVGSVE